MASQYDTETKTQAEALLELGKPASHVAQEMSILERTRQRWATGWQQMAAEEGDRLHEALDQMEGEEDL